VPQQVILDLCSIADYVPQQVIPDYVPQQAIPD
jgi:hypothetical protein